MGNGLTDGQQAIVMVIALAFIGFGAVSIPTNVAPAWFGVVLIFIGIIGAALKEVYGSKSSVPAPASPASGT